MDRWTRIEIPEAALPCKEYYAFKLFPYLSFLINFGDRVPGLRQIF